MLTYLLAGLSAACLYLFAIPSAHGLGMLIPAYFDADPGTGSNNWDKLRQAATKVPLVAIADPGHPGGPGTSRNPNLNKAINALRSAGGKVLGYVDTSYTTVPFATVKADIDKWVLFYAIDGIFIDQMTYDPNPAHLDYYATIYKYIRTNHLAYFIVGNPGIQTQEQYLSRPTADALITHENSKGYTNYVTPAWVTNWPPMTFSQIPYEVGTATTMSNYVQQATMRNVGWIDVTSAALPNPWDTLPAYWDLEVDLVQKLNRAQLKPSSPPPVSPQLQVP